MKLVKLKFNLGEHRRIVSELFLPFVHDHSAYT